MHPDRSPDGDDRHADVDSGKGHVRTGGQHEHLSRRDFFVSGICGRSLGRRGLYRSRPAGADLRTRSAHRRAADRRPQRRSGCAAAPASTRAPGWPSGSGQHAAAVEERLPLEPLVLEPVERSARTAARGTMAAGSGIYGWNMIAI